VRAKGVDLTRASVKFRQEIDRFLCNKHITDIGNMAELPDWVKKHKTKGIAIEKRGDSYLASRVTSVWNPQKKRADKVTIEYLGTVTPKGILPPKHKRPPRIGGILDAGNFVFLERFTKQLSAPLEEIFPDDWQSIIAAAAIRLCYRDPFSRMRLRYETSYSKRLWPQASLNKNTLSSLLPRLGTQWPAQRDFFAKVASDEKHMAIDLSHIFSDSENIAWLEFGHNGDEIWRHQIGILLMWGTTTHRPGFLKLLPGATHSAQALTNAVWESGLQDLTAVLDKGFWSPDNMAYLESVPVHYAMALRRNLPFLKYVPHNRYKDYFFYRNHAQWWRSLDWDKRTIYYYLDKSIAASEESNYLEKVKEGKITNNRYAQLKNKFGTLAILTDTGLSAEEVYALYKERRDVEYAFDTLQNTLDADVTWMRSRESLQGYLFIQFAALHLYSQVLDHLKRKKLLQQYSVQDILTYLSKVNVVEVNGKDRIGEVTKQTKRVIELLEVPITEMLGL
jgi:hypothetical protein